MIVAILPILGLIIGASLQYFFTRYLENQRHHRELRTQAYLDYLKSISELAHLNDPQGSQERDLFAKVADAKARICLYGSEGVLRAFALFEKLGATITSPMQQKAFVGMVLAMREDSGSTYVSSTEDIEMLLLGKHDWQGRDHHRSSK